MISFSRHEVFSFRIFSFTKYFSLLRSYLDKGILLLCRYFALFYVHILIDVYQSVKCKRLKDTAVFWKRLDTLCSNVSVAPRGRLVLGYGVLMIHTCPDIRHVSKQWLTMFAFTLQRHCCKQAVPKQVQLKLGHLSMNILTTISGVNNLLNRLYGLVDSLSVRVL